MRVDVELGGVPVDPPRSVVTAGAAVPVVLPGTVSGRLGLDHSRVPDRATEDHRSTVTVCAPLRACAQIVRRNRRGPEPITDSGPLTCTNTVGDAGIEPATSSVSGKRSPAELIALHHSGTSDGTAVLRGGNGIRTRVHGFAGRCLASRPSHRGGNPGDGLDLFESERTTGFEPATLTLAR